MNRLLIVLNLCAPLMGAATLVWETKEGIDTPESAYYDSGSDSIFVSNVAGQADQKDGVGWISRLATNGKVIKAKWIEGLNAPKGLRAHAGHLFVTDIDRVVEMDIVSARIVNTVKFPQAGFLNDLAIDPNGVVYVSDTLTSTVYKIQNGVPSIFAQGAWLESPNGLLASGDALLVAAWGLTTDWSTKTKGRLYSLPLKGGKPQTFLTPTPLGNLDGLEQTAGGDLLVSDWVLGKVYRVARDGTSTEVLSGFKGAADIGWIQSKNTLLVPRMSENLVSAYRL